MAYIGPNGYNFDYLIPENYNGPVCYVYNYSENSPTGYFGYNNSYIILYGDIAGCTGPTCMYFQATRNSILMSNNPTHNGLSGPTRTY